MRQSVDAPILQLDELEGDSFEWVRPTGREEVECSLADFATAIVIDSEPGIAAYTRLEVDVGLGRERERELEMNSVAGDDRGHVGAHEWIGLQVVESVNVVSLLAVRGWITDLLENQIVEFVR